MNKEWVDKKNREYHEQMKEQKDFILREVVRTNWLNDEEKAKIINGYNDGYIFNAYFLFPEILTNMMIDEVPEEEYDKAHKEYDKWVESLCIDEFNNYTYYGDTYDRYLDSEMEFDGDIIITDPCYIVRAKHHGTEPITEDDWAACEYGDKMEALGIQTYMTRDTLYGDWSCTTYDSDTKEPIGEFCADARLVSVFLLDEVLKYNPDFDYHITKPWTTTLIKNFKGTVKFVVLEKEYVHEDDWEGQWKKGDKYLEYEVEVHGYGINKVTGNTINFVGKQTGF